MATCKIEKRKQKINVHGTAKGYEDRFSIAAGDLEAGTPDENIFEIFKCCKEW